MPRVWLCIALLLAPATARAWTLHAGLEQRGYALRASESLLLSQLRYPGLEAGAITERLAYQLRGTAEVEGRPLDSFGLALGLDTGLLELGAEGAFLDGRDPGEQLGRTLLLGRTWAEWQAPGSGAVLARVGKWRARVGDGAIFDAYAFGAMLDIDLGLVHPEHPWQARLQALFPSGTLVAETFESPLFTAEIGYRFSAHSRARGLVALYLDRGAVGPVLSDALLRGQATAIVQAFDRIRDVLDNNPCTPDDGRTNFREAVSCFEQDLLQAANEGRIGYVGDTRGHLGWTGASGRMGGATWSLEGLVLYGFGALDVRFDPNPALEAAFTSASENLPPRAGTLVEQSRAGLARARRVTMSSWLTQLTAKWSAHPDLDLDGFFLALSGDGGLPVGDEAVTYRAFTSLAPLLAHTSLFFGGGAATAVASPTASALAPDAAGLVSGGLGASWFPQDRLRTRVVLAAMGALRDNPGGHRFFGFEVDVLADFLLTTWSMLYVDLAAFVPGAYYGDASTAWQGILGASLRY